MLYLDYLEHLGRFVARQDSYSSSKYPIIIYLSNYTRLIYPQKYPFLKWEPSRLDLLRFSLTLTFFQTQIVQSPLDRPYKQDISSPSVPLLKFILR